MFIRIALAPSEEDFRLPDVAAQRQQAQRCVQDAPTHLTSGNEAYPAQQRNC
jgi:hypothetical protein